MLIEKNKLLIMCGPNVIESEEHTLFMAKKLKEIFNKFLNIQFVFKTSFDKANRTSYNSYRGLGIKEGLKILKKVKDKLNINIITDVHEPYQVEQVSKVVDILQVPAFLCRQTDLIEAVAKTDKIVHVKKGQFLNADSMLKVVEKLRKFGHKNEIILCERGTMFGYNDLIVDTRNLVWMKSSENLVSMDITHCLQRPAQKMKDGTIKAGGIREMIPYMGKMAIAFDVNGIFMEVHDNPEKALCDGPTQWPLDKLEWLLNFLLISKKIHKKINIAVPCRLKSSRLKNKMLIDLKGEKIINRTINGIKKSNYDGIITVITDSNDIRNVLDKNIKTIITNKEYLNGTERISDNLETFEGSHIMIIHGDQPFINEENINIMLEYFQSDIFNGTDILMGYTEIDEEEASMSSIAKIVTNDNNYLYYISRAKIPFFKNKSKLKYKKGTSLVIIPKEKLSLYNKFATSDLQLSEDNEWIKFFDKLDCKIKCIKLNNVERDLNDINDYNYLVNKYK